MRQKWWIALVILCVLAAAVMFGNHLIPATEYEGILIVRNLLVQSEISEQNVTEAISISQEHVEQQEDLLRYIEEQIADMSLEEKLAQMMILTNENDITAGNLSTYQPGGIIFFAKDFRGKSAEQVRKRVDGLQAYMNIPLFVGVDEEGGAVSRIAGMTDEKLPEFQSARVLYGMGGIEAVRQETGVKSDLLLEMGINLNFDPVADVVVGEKAYMYERSASGNAEEAAEYVETVVITMREKNIGCCLKHFPGYGDNVNTHKTYARDSKSLESYRENDFMPFQYGVAAGANMIMVSHIIMEAVDSKNPASLSLEVHNLLREELDFSGVVVADDLKMKAILNSMTLENATAKALIAGNDMIFSADFMASMRGAKSAVEEGKLTEQQIEKSLIRILKMKAQLGLLTTEE